MYRFFAVLLISVSFVLLSSCGLSDDTVAKVGDIKISADDFKLNLASRYKGLSNYTSVDSAAKRTMLNQIIDRELKVNAALDLDLDEDPDFIKEMKNAERNVLLNKYYEYKIVDALFPEEVVRDNYFKRKDEVNASHILIGFKGSRSKAGRSKEEALALARDIVKQIKAGADFAKLAKKYSDDPSAAKNKGNMGFFTWGRMVDPFQEAAFSMKPGEVSDPVETVFGYHVIKVLERRPNPKFNAEDYEANKLDIKKRLYFTKKDSAIALWNTNMEKLKAENHFKMNDANMDSVMAWVKDLRKAGRITPESFSDKQKNVLLASWDGGELRLSDLFDTFQGRNFPGLLKRINEKKMFGNTLGRVCGDMLVEADAKKMHIDKEKEVQAQLTNMAHQRLARLAEQKEVKDKIVLTDEELKKYYEEHLSEFKKPAEMEMWEIYVTNEKLAKKIARLARAGRNFEKLAEKYTEDDYYKKKKGYLGYRQEKRRGSVSKEAFKIGENKISDPVKYRKGWAIVKTGKLKPETIRSFEDASRQVRSKLNGTKLRERRRQWDKELKDKYDIKINDDLLVKI